MAIVKYTLVSLTLLLFASPSFSEELTVQLTTGSTLTGDFTRQVGGLFLKTETGGKQIPWKRLNPHSLPEDLRISLQNRLALELDRADQLYYDDQVPEAAPVYAKVLLHRAYLDLDTQTSPVFKDINRKARGLVLHNDQWIPFRQRQEQLGLVLDRGNWIPRETAAVNAKFDAVQRQARLRTDYNRMILDLLALIRQYPESDRIPEAEALVTRIDNWLRAKEKQAQEQAKAQVVQHPQPQVQIIERVIEREPVFSTYGGWSPYQSYGFHQINYSSPQFTHGHSHSHHSNGNSGGLVQVGATFNKTQNRFNTGYPFAPPVSVQLTGQPTSTQHSHHTTQRANHHRQHRLVSQPGLNVNGQVGNVGIRIQRKDPIKIRF